MDEHTPSPPLHGFTPANVSARNKGLVIATLSPKGGAGKTTMAATLASSLADLGFRVGMIDADPNYPLHRWASKDRLGDKITVSVDTDPDGDAMMSNIKEVAANNHFVIVDTEGTANRRGERACLMADLVLIPFNPSPLDFREAAKASVFIDKLNAMLAETGSPRRIAYVLAPTKVPHVGMSKQMAQGLGKVRESGKPIIENTLSNRSAYTSMFQFFLPLHGLSDNESPGLEKARAEARRFTDEVLSHLYAQLDLGKKGAAA